MTIAENDRRKEYDGNGVTTAFTGPRAFSADHIAVYLVDDATGVATLTTAYTLSNVGVRNRQTTVTMDDAPEEGTTLLILRTVPYEQGTNITNQGPFLPQVVEEMGDSLAQQVQQLDDRNQRALRFDDTVILGSFDASLPTPVALAPIVVNEDGTAFEMGDTNITGDMLLRGQLADAADAAKGAALVKYGRTETGAVSTTARKRLLALPHTPEEFNATADGVADDTAELNAAISASREVDVSGDYLVTSVTNPYGTELKGRGRVLKVDPLGGFQQLNSRAYAGQHVFGQNYLSAFQEILHNKQDPATILMSGDSTTFGDAATTPCRIWEVLQILGTERGHAITVTNGGHSGKHTGEWVSDYLTADLATNPSLYVVRWGINDPFYDRDIVAYATSLRAGLAQIRATKTLAQMSVLLMTPNSTNDSPNDRDERWYEQVRLVCRQAAIDYQCAFIDTYALWKDVRGAAGLYMDAPFADARAIHPKNVMNAWIGTVMADLLFPAALRPRLFHSTYGTLLAATLPDRYPFGQSIYSGASGSSDFGVTNPSVVTLRTADGGVYQRAFSNFESGANNGNYPVPQLMERTGVGSAWHTYPITEPSLDLTSLLVNGWVPFDATLNKPRAKKTNNEVTLNGLIKSGTTAATTILFTLPAGYRPRNSVEVFHQAMGPTGTTTACVIHVASTGVVTLQSVGNAAFVSLSGMKFEVGG